MRRFKLQLYMKGEFLMYRGQIGQWMGFISRGVCIVLDPDRDDYYGVHKATSDHEVDMDEDPAGIQWPDFFADEELKKKVLCILRSGTHVGACDHALARARIRAAY